MNLLNKVHFKSKNYKKAAETAIVYANYKDSIDVLQNKKVLLDIETKYQTEKKEQEIALLKSEKALTAQKQKNQRNLLLGGLGITSIAGLFLFILYRNRQKTNNKLKELNTLKSNFFANISHEFRTPLTLISSPIDDILTHNSISDKNRQQFTVAKQNSERLLSLVNQLLDLSKIDAGQLKLHLQQNNVLQLISALSESFNHSATQKNIDLNLNIKQREENVWFDKDAVEKITVNLLSNALKYTPENGLVVCNAYIENHKLVLQVKNTGTGLTYEESNHIFDRFYQTNEQNQGTGIGLALVKELVELHKGTIEVTSTPNEWTTFNVTISVDKNSLKNATILSTDEADSKIESPIISSTIFEDDNEFVDSELPILLIVEDNNDLRHLLKQTFEEHYTVISAPNGKLGIELALETIPDLIISDIMMPEKDGITLTNDLKNDERSAHIPIILLTAKADVESKFTGIDTGADDYITKPFDKKLLVLKVEKLIESRKKLQARYSQEVILKPKDIAFTNLDELFLNKVQIVLDNQLVESSFSVEDFSKAVGMSRMQLHRKIKALTGLSASEFIRSQRLKLAAQLLKQSDINISQVGYSVGFNDHAYFSKCFKDTYKCTPTEYAKKS
ncbi:MAG: response regulator [Flavobacteriales bacterium]|nr:response regulator [Flavobacteriales bacterium]